MTSNIKYTIKSIASVFVFLLILSAFSSCTDNFEEMNRKQGEPTEEEMSPYLPVVIFGQMIDNVYSSQENSYQMNQNLIGDPYGRYLSISNKGFTRNFAIFNAPDGWVNYPYEDVFPKFYGAWRKLREKVDPEQSRMLLEWSNILRVATMHRLGDMYGPIPYSKIGDGINAPYDSVEELYRNMIKDLDTAIDYLTQYVEQNPDARVLVEPEKGDVVYGSDLKKWTVFANSLKLRLAMRTVYADPDFAKTKAEEAVNHKLGVIVSNDQMPKYVFPAGSNPVYKMSTEWGDCMPAADIITYMKGYADPRLPFYFTKAQLKDDKGEALDVDYLGIRTGINIADEKPVMNSYSGVNYAQNDASVWMTAAEVAFLRAEGALRGWNMGGAAQELYESGIRLSFEQWGAGGVDVYINDAEKTQADYDNPKHKDTSIKAISKITIKWNASADFEENLERIITQKWIAMYPLGTEAWSEQRRTGYPRFFPVMSNASDERELTTKLAARIPFAPSEKLNNPTNYEDGVSKLGGPDKYGTRLWWDKKTNKPN